MFVNYWNPYQDMKYLNASPRLDFNYQNYPVETLNHTWNYDVASDYNQKQYQDIQLSAPPYRATTRDINLYSNSAYRNDLGNGFMSFEWRGEAANNNEFLRASLKTPGMKVISGGWAPSGFNPLYALESFPNKTDEWVITVHNQQTEGEPRAIRFFVIAKA